MTRTLLLILCLGFVAACDSGGGSVLQDSTDTDTDEPTDNEGNPIDSDGGLPPGTVNPTPDALIFRTEPLTEDGNGYVRGVRYDSDNDTFFVEGLGFDSSQPDGQEYTRPSFGTPPGTPFALYEAPAFFPDSLTGTPIPQFEHRALYGVSQSGQTEFAIVRTGAYLEYGFGGFVYQRNNEVVLPAEGQANYVGSYAGIRDFNGKGGLEITSANARLAIDFSGFRGNCSAAECDNAVRGEISNRRIYDTEGNDITRIYLDAAGSNSGGGGSSEEVYLEAMPNLIFKVGPGVADANGELTGQAFSNLLGQEFEVGNYYALMSGDHTQVPGGEIVGVIVVESSDPRFVDVQVTTRETGGFIVYRQ
jgi:hypothetical protein